jgi:hypothetical protein
MFLFFNNGLSDTKAKRLWCEWKAEQGKRHQFHGQKLVIGKKVEGTPARHWINKFIGLRKEILVVGAGPELRGQQNPARDDDRKVDQAKLASRPSRWSEG